MLPLHSPLGMAEIKIRKEKTVREKPSIGCRLKILRQGSVHSVGWCSWLLTKWAKSLHTQEKRGLNHENWPLYKCWLCLHHHCIVPFALVTAVLLVGHWEKCSSCDLGGNGFGERPTQAIWAVMAGVETWGSRSCVLVSSSCDCYFTCIRCPECSKQLVLTEGGLASWLADSPWVKS